MTVFTARKTTQLITIYTLWDLGFSTVFAPDFPQGGVPFPHRSRFPFCSHP